MRLDNKVANWVVLVIAILSFSFILGCISGNHSSSPITTPLKTISAGKCYTVQIDQNGTLWAWGFNYYGQLGLDDSGLGTDRATPTQVGYATDWLDISTGNSHTIALKEDGTLWAWGYNFHGQLGLGDSGSGTDRAIPTQVGDDTDWLAISAGSLHTIALKEDGTLWAWGYNYYGQLGLDDSGSGTDRATPTQVGTATDWLAISAGSSHTIALKEDGTLWAWGFNHYGQLGLDDSGLGTDRAIPTQVGDDTDWLAISAGSLHTIALKEDGTLWAWGYNYYGQLGLDDSGSGTDRATPTQVGTATDWLAISAGSSHTIALKEDGTLWAWGFNHYGQLGLDDSGLGTDRAIPTQVGDDTDWLAISAGDNHTIALKENRTLWAWGHNSSGQLGLDNTTKRVTPTQVGTATDWLAISGGSTHTIALKEDGTLWAWGGNYYGQLGLGDSGSGTDRTIPTQVGTATNWYAISAGDDHTIALKEYGTLWAWGFNSNGQLGLGNTDNTDTPTLIN